MKIVVIGSGMYVTGREGTGSGTILASLIQLAKYKKIDSILIVSKSATSESHVNKATAEINQKLGSSIAVDFLCIANGIADLENIFKSKTFDAAIVSVPDALHFDYVKSCITHQIPTLVVKPLTPTYAEAKELIALSENNKVYGAVEFHKRWDESNLFAKRVIAENKIGDINYIQVDYSQKIKIPTEVFRAWSNETNIMQYLGIHYIDLIHFLTDYMPIRVSAYGTKKTLVEKGIDTYDSIHAFIEWQDTKNEHQKFISIINANWIDANSGSAMSDQKIKFIGTLGRLECDQKDRGIELINDTTGVQLINPYFSEYLSGDDGNMILNGYGFKSIERFVLDVIDLKNNAVSFEYLIQHRPSFRSASISTLVSDFTTQSLAQQNKWLDITK
ncbi:MAG: Gfo/Idh/MocA family oxidoreductase [Bacteroidota bacterium]